MAYAFQREESVSAAVRRIMGEQIVRAREHLADKNVHNARKRFKEIRALARLTGNREENAWFRDAGRELAAARDAEAVIEALDKLGLPGDVDERVRKQLTVPKDPELDVHIGNVLDRLVIAQARITMSPELENSFEALANGLRRTYRGGRRAMHGQTADELHEWRKRVKEHWYHAQLLQGAWPEVLGPYAATLDELSKALGDHHDLHVLHDRVDDADLHAAIDVRQRELEARARAIGSRVYAEKPGPWLARMRNVWNAWRTT